MVLQSIFMSKSYTCYTYFTGKYKHYDSLSIMEQNNSNCFILNYNLIFIYCSQYFEKCLCPLITIFQPLHSVTQHNNLSRSYFLFFN